MSHPAGHFRHGVRGDSAPWVAYWHPDCENVVSLFMPNHPDFERARVACWDYEDTHKQPPRMPEEPDIA